MFVYDYRIGVAGRSVRIIRVLVIWTTTNLKGTRLKPNLKGTKLKQNLVIFLVLPSHQLLRGLKSLYYFNT
jgi:hypothetical protein